MQIKSDKVFNICSPHIFLRKYVLYYNIVFPKDNVFAENYTLMPDACGTLSIAFDGNKILAEVWGSSVTPTHLGTEPNGYQFMLLIQFSSYGLYQLTHYNQTEFADKRILLEYIDIGLYHSFCDVIYNANNVEELCSMCDKILYHRMEYCYVSDALLSASQIIYENKGQIPVSKLAQKVNYSERHLNRLFLMQIGINVKYYARIVRFNNVLNQIKTSPILFAELSQKSGYCDQPHFDKDFKSLSGISPQDYLKNMSDFYYDDSELLYTLSSRRDNL